MRGEFVHVALFALTLAACNLTQEAPSRVIANDLYAPGNAQLLVTSTISDFECALGQYIVATGLVGDELIDAQLSQAGWDYDRRTIVPAFTPYATLQCGSVQVPGYYTPVAIARATADKILTSLEGWTDADVTGRQDFIGQAATIAGYALVLLGETSCSAAIDAGPELTPTQVLTEAEASVHQGNHRGDSGKQHRLPEHGACGPGARAARAEEVSRKRKRMQRSCRTPTCITRRIPRRTPAARTSSTRSSSAGCIRPSIRRSVV